MQPLDGAKLPFTALAKLPPLHSTPAMQFDLFPSLRRSRVSREEALAVNGRSVALRFVRHPNARRYVLRLDHDGAARVTVPRAGSYAEARKFVEQQTGWIERQIIRRATERRCRHDWPPGTEIFFRGERLALVVSVVEGEAEIRFGDQTLRVRHLAADLRPMIEAHLRQLAVEELPPRVNEFARVHQLTVRRVQVRDQQSRWGSCSRRGTISLNWRLIQTPPLVRDYIILHELMHLRQMNHSARFWKEVETACPAYPQAEAWLKRFGKGLLRR